MQPQCPLRGSHTSNCGGRNTDNDKTAEVPLPDRTQKAVGAQEGARDKRQLLGGGDIRICFKG